MNEPTQVINEQMGKPPSKVDIFIKTNIKKLKKIPWNKKTKIMLALVLALSFILFSFFSAVIKQIQLQTATQGQMLFWVIDERDISDTKVIAWIEENQKEQGIHVYDTKDKKTSEKLKYILLATGKQTIEGIAIKMESVEGLRDKIIINGRVEPPSLSEGEKEAYPYIIVMIQGNDPREIVLGTMNLFDINRGIANQSTNITMDTAIVTEIGENTIKIATFKNESSSPIYSLSSKAINEINATRIKAGDLVAVNINNDTSEGYPTLIDIRKTTIAYEKVFIKSIDSQAKLINVEISKTPMSINYLDTIQDKVNKTSENKEHLVKIEKVGEGVYITDLIGK
jgi:hypothetical protein